MVSTRGCVVSASGVAEVCQSLGAVDIVECARERRKDLAKVVLRILSYRRSVSQSFWIWTSGMGLSLP